jgi:RND superfamily putative drug exporter
MLPAVLEILGKWTWKLPKWIDTRLPHINIEGSSAREAEQSPYLEAAEPEEREVTSVGR